MVGRRECDKAARQQRGALELEPAPGSTGHRTVRARRLDLGTAQGRHLEVPEGGHLASTDLAAGSDLADEPQYCRRRDLRLLRLWVVSRLGNNDDLSMEHLRDPLGLCLRVLE